MKRSSHIICASLCAISLCGFASTAAAQDRPSMEISGGWRFLHSTEIDESLSAGWYADVAGSVTNAIAIVGEVAGAYKTVEETVGDFGPPVTVTGTLRLHTFMGGVRFSARQHPRVVPFAQVLFGVARLSATVEGSATVAGRTTTINESETENEFAIDTGAGVNIRLVDNIGVRFGASYVRFGASDGGNAVRVSTGVVIPF